MIFLMDRRPEWAHQSLDLVDCLLRVEQCAERELVTGRAIRSPGAAAEQDIVQADDGLQQRRQENRLELIDVNWDCRSEDTSGYLKCGRVRADCCM